MGEPRLPIVPISFPLLRFSEILNMFHHPSTGGRRAVSWSYFCGKKDWAAIHSL
jgi:hypothetical protein